MPNEDSRAVTPPPTGGLRPAAEAPLLRLRRSHDALNAVIHTLLEWFKAYYALDNIAMDVQSARAPTSESDTIPMHIPLPADDESDSDSDSDSSDEDSSDEDGSGDDSDGVGTNHGARAQAKKNKKLAKKLKSHRAMIKLFKRTLSTDWPDKDRVKDRMSNSEDDANEAFETENRPDSNKRTFVDGTQPAAKRAKTVV